MQKSQPTIDAEKRRAKDRQKARMIEANRARAYQAAARDSITNSAAYNAEFLRDTLDGFCSANTASELDPLLCATARFMSVLIAMRSWSQGGARIDADLLQATIDAWMASTGVDTVSLPMGGEKYVRVLDKPAVAAKLAESTIEPDGAS